MGWAHTPREEVIGLGRRVGLGAAEVGGGGGEERGCRGGGGRGVGVQRWVVEGRGGLEWFVAGTLEVAEEHEFLLSYN